MAEWMELVWWRGLCSASTLLCYKDQGHKIDVCL